MKKYLASIMLSILVVGICGCNRNRQQADAVLCESDKQFHKPSFVFTGQKNDEGKFYFDVTYVSVFHSKTYSSLPSINPPLEGVEFPAVIEVGSEPKQFRTLLSDDGAINISGRTELSSAYRAVDVDNEILKLPVVGRYPVLGNTRIVQTPENLSTHTVAAGNDQAIDIGAPRGSVVTAFKPGVVEYVDDKYHDDNSCGSEYSSTYTNILRVLQDDGFEALYAHLQRESILVAAGQRVEAGQPLAKVGCFNVCSNSHLHLQVGTVINYGYKSVPVLFYTDKPESAWQPHAGEVH